MTRISFVRSQFDHCVYFRFSPGNSFFIFLLYVDYILIASNNVEEVMRVKAELNKEFEMKDLRAASRILGIDIRKDRKLSKVISRGISTEDSRKVWYDEFEACCDFKKPLIQ